MNTNLTEGTEVEIEGIIDSVRFKNITTGYTVIDIDQGSDIVCAVGKMLTVHEGEYIKIKGTVKNDPTYGEQISVSEYEQSEPNNADTAYRFLSSGVIKGIGKSLKNSAKIQWRSSKTNMTVLRRSKVFLRKKLTLYTIRFLKHLSLIGCICS